jgi:hypothetical protein
LRILFDNNVPLGLRAFLSGHEVRNLIEMNWSPELENGELIEKVEAAGFDVLVTADQNIQYQQNLIHRRLALVVLKSNLWPRVRMHAPAILAAIEKAIPGSYQSIFIPAPSLAPKRPGNR